GGGPAGAAARQCCWSAPRPSAASGERGPRASRSIGPSSTAIHRTRNSASRRATRASAVGRRFRAHPAAGVRAVRERAAPRARRADHRAPRAHRGALVALLAGCVAQPARVDPAACRRTRSPHRTNRTVGRVPYTKYLVANMVVDLGAALILCSIDAARRHGIAESRWVYRHACTDAFETTPIGVRATLHDQAAI